MGNTFSILEQQVFYSLILQNYKLKLKDEKDQKIEILSTKGVLSPKPCDIEFIKIN